MRRRPHLIAGILVLATGASAIETPTLADAMRKVQAAAVKHQPIDLSRSQLEKLAKSSGGASYVKVTWLRPTQNRASLQTAGEKILAEDGLRHDDGKALFGKDDAKDAVLGPRGAYLIDGHHGVLASLGAGATTFSIRIRADLSWMSKRMFWRYLRLRGWSLLERPDGTAPIPQTFGDLQESPNRHFARLVARKVKTVHLGKVKSSGADVPIWVKTPQVPPFIEFYVADVLSKAGIHYESSMGSSPAEKLVERARRALVAAKRAGHPKLKNLPILEKRTTWTELHDAYIVQTLDLKAMRTEEAKSPFALESIAKRSNQQIRKARKIVRRMLKYTRATRAIRE